MGPIADQQSQCKRQGHPGVQLDAKTRAMQVSQSATAGNAAEVGVPTPGVARVSAQDEQQVGGQTLHVVVLLTQRLWVLVAALEVMHVMHSRLIGIEQRLQVRLLRGVRESEEAVHKSLRLEGPKALAAREHAPHGLELAVLQGLHQGDSQRVTQLCGSPGSGAQPRQSLHCIPLSAPVHTGNIQPEAGLEEVGDGLRLHSARSCGSATGLHDELLQALEQRRHDLIAAAAALLIAVVLPQSIVKDTDTNQQLQSRDQVTLGIRVAQGSLQWPHLSSRRCRRHL